MDCKIDRMGVNLDEWIGINGNRLVRTAIEMLDDAHIDRRGLVVAHLNRKGLVQTGSCSIELITRLLSLASQVEGVACIDSQSLMFGRVVNLILADKFQLPVCVLLVEPHATLRQWHAEIIGFAVDELAHGCDFRIRLRAVVLSAPNGILGPAVVLLRVELQTIVNVDLLVFDMLGMYELRLLGLMAAERCRMLKRIQVVFVERLFRNRRRSHV